LISHIVLQILGVTADNATSNDTQRKKLARMDNSFLEQNHVRCFNHTLQLSAKALLRPFNPALGKAADINCNGGQDGLLVMEDDDENGHDGESDHDGEDDHDGENGHDSEDDHDSKDDHDSEDDHDGENDHDGGNDEEGDLPNIPDIDDGDDDDDDDGIDEVDNLDSRSRAKLVEDTAIVRAVVSKLRQLSFSIVRSTTIALPAWRSSCQEFGLKPRTFPRDVVTRWNSTFDMLSFALEYRRVIDSLTRDKNLTLGEFHLAREEWLIVEDLVAILQVTTVVYHLLMVLTLLHHSDSKTQRSISPEILLVLQQSFLLWIG
jgi:hypothetical protein